MFIGKTAKHMKATIEIITGVIILAIGCVMGTAITRSYMSNTLSKTEQAIYHDAVRNGVAEVYIDKNDKISYRWVEIFKQIER